MRAPRLSLPPAPRTAKRWYLFSAAVHVVLIGGWVLLSAHYGRDAEPLLRLPEAPELPRITLRYVRPTGAAGQPGARALRPSDALRIPRDTVVRIVVPVEVRLNVRMDSLTVSLRPIVGTSRRLGPSVGDGRLWHVPVEIPFEDGVVLDPIVVAADLDSLIFARLMAFLDTLPPDPFASPDSPSWVTEIGGKKWGIDEKWIHLGDIKLPAALLALIPAPEGNYYQAKQAQAMQRIREEIIRTTQRQEDLKDIRGYIAELRARKAAERDASRHDRAAADSVARDSLIP